MTDEEIRALRDAYARPAQVSTGAADLVALADEALRRGELALEHRRYSAQVWEERERFHQMWFDEVRITKQLRERLARLEAALRSIFEQFTPEHIDYVSGTDVGTRARAALEEKA